MVKAGADKMRLAAFNSSIHCFINDSDVVKTAALNGRTRSEAAVDKAAALQKPFIFAIGNAPTALMRVCELKRLGQYSPEFVIGVPVGFVNAAESKEILITSDIPYITSRGRKGGSNVAAAIINALTRMAGDV
jgi:precorrin-8X/cobalt-precorrin-8 methylmutase